MAATSSQDIADKKTDDLEDMQQTIFSYRAIVSGKTPGYGLPVLPGTTPYQPT